MANQGLLFIPDISGFTRFVNETEIDHSRLIIQELLEVLINANQIGLEVSEIEGDAILFYKFGDPPALEVIYKQVESMFCAFHSSLAAYDHRRYCQCKACVSAIKLTLKVITHYGEFTGYNVHQFNKLIGKDIIVAHQLLKNDIEQHEYWLVTPGVLPEAPPLSLREWMNWNRSAKQTESGEVPFHYTLLSQLRNQIPPDPLPEINLSEKAKMISLSREYETDIITLFHATGDFQHRSHWQDGVREVVMIDHHLPRLGMRCRSIFDTGEVITYGSSCRYQNDRIEFTETSEKDGAINSYLLEKTGKGKIKLTLGYYLDKNLYRQLLFKLTKKKKMLVSLHRSMDNLEKLVKELVIPTAESTT